MAAIGNRTNERTSVRFTVADLIAWSRRSQKTLTAADYYPFVKKSGGQYGATDLFYLKPTLWTVRLDL